MPKKSLLPLVDVYAWILDGPNGKGILGVNNPNGETIAMACTDKKAMKNTRAAIKEIARHHGVEITLVKFTAAEVLDIVHCATQH